MKLNQAIAIIQDVKAKAARARTELYHKIQKRELFEGLSRTYAPHEEDGFVYPSEGKPIQASAPSLVEEFEAISRDLYDFAATQDYANTRAIASVVVDGEVLIKDAPVTFLLFLEKELENVRTFVKALPVQDIGEEWTFDVQRDCYATTPKFTTKTKRIVKPVVLYEATSQHPAQVKESSEDVPEGLWKTIKFTSAIPQSKLNEVLKRIDALQRAIVFAREEANSIEVEKLSVAPQIFQYLFS